MGAGNRSRFQMSAIETIRQLKEMGFAPHPTQKGILVSQKFLDEVTAAAVEGVATAVHNVTALQALGEVTYPKDHQPGMRVPKGGSSCISCKFVSQDGTKCSEPNFQKWNGSPKIPGKADEYCSDWYVSKIGVEAVGTSEGAYKGWEHRQRSLTLGADAPSKDKPVVVVFGGSFNPPHIGHYEALERARNLLQEQGYRVDNVLVAPTAPKLLKAKLGAGAYPLDDRVAMSKLTFIGPGIQVTGEPAREAEGMEGKLRRTQLADWAQKEYPGHTVVNVTGEDAAPGHPPGYPSLYAGDKGSNHEGYYYLALDRPVGGLSSTKIREQMAQGQTPVGMTPEAVSYLNRVLGLGNWTKSGINVGIFDRPEEHVEGKTIPVESVFKNPPPSYTERKDIVDAFAKASKVGEMDLPVDKLIPMQKTLETTRLDRIAKGIPLTKTVSPVAAFQRGGNYYLMDGHHRAGGDIIRGDKTIRVSRYITSSRVSAAAEDKNWWYPEYNMGLEDMEDYIHAAEEDGWHGVDLDGTIAYYDKFRGYDHIGKALEDSQMVKQVREWLENGEKVKIFTARASEQEAIKPIEEFCQRVFGQKLEITDKKDHEMIDSYDDRNHVVKKNTGEIIAADVSSMPDQRGTMWNNIKLVGFTGPEEEALRAMLSRIPPDLFFAVDVIQSAKELNAKHGKYIPDEKKIMFNPNNLVLRQRFGKGDGWLLHAELTVVHEVGHSLYDNLSPEEKQRWLKISGWMKGSKEGQAPAYVETRPGWDAYTSEWTHKAGAKFPRYYAEKSPNEDFADSFGFFILSKAHQIGDAKRKFFEDYLKDHVKRYVRVSIQSPSKPYIKAGGPPSAHGPGSGNYPHLRRGLGRSGQVTGREGQYAAHSVTGRIYRRLGSGPVSLSDLRGRHGKQGTYNALATLDRHGLRSDRWRIGIKGDQVTMRQTASGSRDRPLTPRQISEYARQLSPSGQTQPENRPPALSPASVRDLTPFSTPAPAAPAPRPPTPAAVPSPPVENTNSGFRRPVGFLKSDASPNPSDRVAINPDQVADFKRDFGMSPDHYRDILLRGIGDKDFANDVRIRFDHSRYDRPGESVWQVSAHTYASGKRMTMDRTIDLGHKTVGHDMFTLDSGIQGQGYAKHFFANSLDLYDHLGIKSIHVGAGLSGGGDTWARFGFVPTESSWRYLRNSVAQKAEASRDLTPDLKAQVKIITSMNDPRAIWVVAALRNDKGDRVGKNLLRGTGWDGNLDLQNREQYDITRNYSGRV